MSDLTGAAEKARADKITLRGRLLTQRRSSPTVPVGSLQDQILALVRRTAAATVAAYVPVGTEPGGPDLPARLAEHARVLLPVLLPSGDLDWAAFDGELAAGPRGLLEPASARLGPAAIRSASLVLVPALAVDRRGMRLGRGGGSYDRALDRLADTTALVVALLHEDELLPVVPAEPHDRPVHGVVRPSGFVSLRPGPEWTK
jgi:5-formyltetrahydrofolate cyclo-ligase